MKRHGVSDQGREKSLFSFSSFLAVEYEKLRVLNTSLHKTAKFSLWAMSESCSNVRFHFMFSLGTARVSTRVCSKFSKRAQLKLREIAVKRLGRLLPFCRA